MNLYAAADAAIAQGWVEPAPHVPDETELQLLLREMVERLNQMGRDLAEAMTGFAVPLAKATEALRAFATAYAATMKDVPDA